MTETEYTVEIEFFPGDEGDLDASEFIEEISQDDEEYGYEWDDYRKGYVVFQYKKLPNEVFIDDYDHSLSDDELEERLGDILSDTYDFCHFGFDYKINGNTIEITNIKWDTGEE